MQTVKNLSVLEIAPFAVPRCGSSVKTLYGASRGLNKSSATSPGLHVFRGFSYLRSTGQPRSENPKWEIPEMNNAHVLNSRPPEQRGDVFRCLAWF